MHILYEFMAFAAGMVVGAFSHRWLAQRAAASANAIAAAVVAAKAKK